MPNTSTDWVPMSQDASAERESGDAAPGMQKMMQEVETLSFAMSPVSFNLVHRTTKLYEVLLQMLQIVQSCSVGVCYHLIFVSFY